MVTDPAWATSASRGRSIKAMCIVRSPRGLPGIRPSALRRTARAPFPHGAPQLAEGEIVPLGVNDGALPGGGDGVDARRVATGPRRDDPAHRCFAKTIRGQFE